MDDHMRVAAAKLKRNRLLHYCSTLRISGVDTRTAKTDALQAFVAYAKQQASRDPRAMRRLYERICAEAGVDAVAAPADAEALLPSRDASTPGCVCGKAHPDGTPVHVCVFCGTAYAKACSAMSLDGFCALCRIKDISSFHVVDVLVQPRKSDGVSPVSATFKVAAAHVAPPLRVVAVSVTLEAPFAVAWQRKVSLMVNGAIVAVPTVLSPHNAVRPGRAVDLGAAVRVSLPNFLSVETPDTRVHYVAVLVVRDVPRADLACAILARRGVPVATAAACAVAAVRGACVSVSALWANPSAAAAAATDDDDVTMASMTLSLCDPLAHTPMRVPVRGLQCHHVQCFDLLCYLRFQETPSFSSWLCPLCGKPVRLLSLCIDTFMLDIMRRVRKGELRGTATAALDTAAPPGFWTAVPVTDLPPPASSPEEATASSDSVRLFPDGSWEVVF